MATPKAANVGETLEWEARQRPRVAAAAILAGVLILVGQILLRTATSDTPVVPAIDALKDAAGKPVPGGGLLTPRVLFIDHHSSNILLATIVGALGVILIAPVLGYLYSATKARRPDSGLGALGIGLVGPILFAVASITLTVGLSSHARSFADGSSRSTKAAHDALQGGILGGAQVLQLIAGFSLAAGFVMIAWGAQRVGLLTKFMGVLGMIVGGTNLIGLDQFHVIQVFWMIAVGLIILGKGPVVVPSAWKSGLAEPWPTQQELREQREAAEGKTPAKPKAKPKASAIEPGDDSEPVATTASHSASKKKKRKRR